MNILTTEVSHNKILSPELRAVLYIFSYDLVLRDKALPYVDIDKEVINWFGMTFILGLSFLVLELKEFGDFIRDGHTISSNAFFSSFFSLVGTHGLHIISGLLWMAITLIFITKRGLTPNMVRKLTLLSLFWHFLDIVWIFIFTSVYLRAFI